MKETFETRDIARELARKYSTMTHEELDTLESVLVPMKFAKGEMILSEGEVCENIYYIGHGLIRQFYFKNGKQITEHLNTLSQDIGRESDNFASTRRPCAF